jgi:hypothetical protein
VADRHRECGVEGRSGDMRDWVKAFASVYPESPASREQERAYLEKILFIYQGTDPA